MVRGHAVVDRHDLGAGSVGDEDGLDDRRRPAWQVTRERREVSVLPLDAAALILCPRSQHGPLKT